MGMRTYISANFSIIYTTCNADWFQSTYQLVHDIHAICICMHHGDVYVNT